jgi:chromosome segregation ATPase
MSTSEELIKQVKVKVQDLVNRVDNLKQEKNHLQTVNDQLKIEISQQQLISTARQAEIAELNRRLQEIKESETNLAEVHKEQMRNRISELVHEIDRCIVMLNK